MMISNSLGELYKWEKSLFSSFYVVSCPSSKNHNDIIPLRSVGFWNIVQNFIKCITERP